AQRLQVGTAHDVVLVTAEWADRRRHDRRAGHLAYLVVAGVGHKNSARSIHHHPFGQAEGSAGGWAVHGTAAARARKGTDRTAADLPYLTVLPRNVHIAQGIGTRSQRMVK